MPQRIRHVRRLLSDRPGKLLAHDKLAKMLGDSATRQLIIKWEDGTHVPGPDYRKRLAVLSGYPAEMFGDARETRRARAETLDEISRKLDVLLERLPDLEARVEAAEAHGVTNGQQIGAVLALNLFCFEKIGDLLGVDLRQPVAGEPSLRAPAEDDRGVA